MGTSATRAGKVRPALIQHHHKHHHEVEEGEVSPSRMSNKASKPFHENLVWEHDPDQRFSDHYTILEELGTGGMCKIWKIQRKSKPLTSARGRGRAPPADFEEDDLDEDNINETNAFTSGIHKHTLFAMKEINLSMVEPNDLIPLKNEVKILQSLDHENIIKVYETFTFRDRRMAIVMELCTGGDLYARLPYTEPQAATIAKQILGAVSYLHDHQIAHRDLKL